jgi:hypothetical protein
MKLVALFALLAASALPAFALLAASALPAFAAEDASTLPWNNFVRDANPVAGTQLLATFHVGSRIDTFHIAVPQCASTIAAIDLKVQGAAITVATFGIKFSDGTTKDFNVNKDFADGTDSGWIDLGMFRSMDSRCPAEVYAKASSKGKATVLVYGQMK